MGSGRVEACRDSKRSDGGRRKVGVKSWGEEGFPCWSRPERDMGRWLDLECGSVVRLRYDPYRTTEWDVSPCTLSRRIVRIRSLPLESD